MEKEKKTLSSRTFECFACKRTLQESEMKNYGRSKYGQWFLCKNCSASYAKRVHERLTKEAWKAGPCPRCLSMRKGNDGGFPLARHHCFDCGFGYTIRALEAAS